MATYYVRFDGNDSNTGTGSGSASAFATPGKAASVMVTGDNAYVRGNSDQYDLSSTTAGAGGPIQPTANIKFMMEGYETTPGDKCPNDSFPILAANGNAPTNMVSLDGNFSDAQILKYFEINGESESVVGVKGVMSNEQIFRVVVKNASRATDDVLLVIQCKSDSNTNGFRDGNVESSYAVSSGVGFECLQTFDCLAQDGSIGFKQITGGACRYSTAEGNSSHGFQFDFNRHGSNLLAVDNGGYGYDTDAETILINCADYQNTSGRTSTTPFADINAITLTGNPFVDAASNDFRPNSTVGAGALLRAAGFAVYGQTSNRNVGALQHADPAGGSASGVRNPFSGPIG